MEGFFLGAGLAMFFLMMVAFYRVFKGPNVMNRVLSVNMIGTKTAVLLVIIGTIFKRVDMFVDFALTYALLNFIGSIAVAKFFQRHAIRISDAEVGSTERLESP